LLLWQTDNFPDGRLLGRDPQTKGIRFSLRNSSEKEFWLERKLRASVFR
jgi:hypothetical protein